MKKLSIVIPIYNEEATLKQLVEKVISTDISLLGYQKQLILVNDGSTDSSQDIISSLIKKYSSVCEIVSINNKKNIGKGYCLKSGFSVATGDVFLVQDADLEYFPEKDYISLLKAFEEKKVDFLYGSRTLGTKIFNNHYSSQLNFLLGRFISWITSLLTLVRVTDEPTCYKMFHKKLKSELLSPSENGFQWEPAITMLLLRKGFTYAELPIHYHARKLSEGKKITRYDGLQALWTLLVWKCKKIH